jgi:hypothetical protein
MADETDLSGSKLTLAPIGTQIGFALTTITSGACTCLIAGTSASVRTISGMTVAIGDNLLIMRHGSQRFAIAKLIAPPPIPPPPPPPSNPLAPDPVPPAQDTLEAAGAAPKPAYTNGALVVPAAQTATYRSGTWRTDQGPASATNYTWQGRSSGSSYGIQTGCAFYGFTPQSLSGATITRASVRLRRRNGGSYSARTPTLRLITQVSRPGGAPTLNESTSGPSIEIDEEIVFDLPVAWGQALVDGTRGGIATFISADDPYMVFSGIGTYSAAWTLTLYWRR